MAADADLADDEVLVRGERAVRLRLSDALGDAERVTGTYTIDCSSGDRETGEWAGVGVDALLERAGPPAAATHLVVTGEDDFRVCVALTDALDAMLATARLDASDEGSLPRFLGRSVSGTRSVKRVREVEATALAPGESAADHERLESAEKD